MHDSNLQMNENVCTRKIQNKSQKYKKSTRVIKINKSAGYYTHILIQDQWHDRQIFLMSLSSCAKYVS